MLSGAKHLQYLLQNKPMQILRFAQDDSRGHSFRGLLRLLETSFPFPHTICYPAATHNLSGNLPGFGLDSYGIM